MHSVISSLLGAVEGLNEQCEKLEDALSCKARIIKAQEETIASHKQDKSSNQLLVNATGEVASLKREVSKLNGHIVRVTDDRHAMARDLDTEREMRAQAERQVNELSTRVVSFDDELAKANATTERLHLTCNERARVIQQLVQWAQYRLSADDIIELKRIAGEPT